MAKTSETVATFLSDLIKKLKARGADDLKCMLDLKAQEVFNSLRCVRGKKLLKVYRQNERGNNSHLKAHIVLCILTDLDKSYHITLGDSPKTFSFEQQK